MLYVQHLEHGGQHIAARDGTTVRSVVVECKRWCSSSSSRQASTPRRRDSDALFSVNREDEEAFSRVSATKRVLAGPHDPVFGTARSCVRFASRRRRATTPLSRVESGPSLATRNIVYIPSCRRQKIANAKISGVPDRVWHMPGFFLGCKGVVRPPHHRICDGSSSAFVKIVGVQNNIHHMIHINAAKTHQRVAVANCYETRSISHRHHSSSR